MDKGNHFYKCDLQVHSPRDRNWKGGPCVTELERETYAKEFVKECREAEINAVAITDHHDLVFYEYIHDAAKQELDEDGNLYSNKDQLIVFPGIELTLHSPPIQALIILDANFPNNLFSIVLGSLSIAQANKSDSKTITTEPISVGAISSLNDIYTKLDSNDQVKGRYIILPHVKEKGHKTLMRKGFNEAYAKMPCTGGYVDGEFVIEGDGYRRILEGKVDAYGFKSIAVIQTSDYRNEKHIKDYGVSTWIKWTEPTAEALRQACLAKESRISIVEPEIPQIFIEKIDVTNSAFLSKFQLDFNPQLNSIIGGRGSGKSTILEYLRWCLCDQTETFGNESFDTEIQRRRNNLIEKTLKDVGGEVRVFFMVNGTRHIIKRNPQSEEVLLKIGEGDFENVRPNQIQDLLPIQAYSQKQLSSISVRPEELKRFIEQPISKDLEEVKNIKEDLKSEVKDSYRKLTERKRLDTDLKKNELEITSFKLQVNKLRGGLKGISEGDKKIIDRANFYTTEKNKFDDIELEYKTIENSLIDLQKTLTRFNLKSNENDEVVENVKIIEQLSGERSKHLEKLLEAVSQNLESHKASNKKIEALKSEWTEIRNQFVVIYNEAKAKSSSSKTTLASIKSLEEQITKLERVIGQKKSTIGEINITEGAFIETYNRFIESQSVKVEILKESTSKFAELSDDLIRADFENIIDEESLKSEISNVFSSYRLNIPKIRIEALAEYIGSERKPVESWRAIIMEIKLLSEFNIKPEVEPEFPLTPLLNKIGFTVANKKKISENLESEGLMNLATILPEYLPKFFYKTHNLMGDEIPFEDASAGQQATALLNVLLNQDGYPLIIDQPEDDIDNRAIEKIISSLWNSKKKRQIIISSHNANLVVNGDSELVVCCDYNEASDQTNGYIKEEGSIDKKEIRDEITAIMEGGEKAFKLRKEKYGF